MSEAKPVGADGSNRKVPARRINAHELTKDIRSGMDDASLAKRYGVTTEKLQSLFGKLVAAGLIGQPEIDRREAPADADVLFECPGCGLGQATPVNECPRCGLLLSKYGRKAETEPVQQQQSDHDTPPEIKKPVGNISGDTAVNLRRAAVSIAFALWLLVYSFLIPAPVTTNPLGTS